MCASLPASQLTTQALDHPLLPVGLVLTISHTHLPVFLQNAADPAVVDKLMSSLDKDNDGELSFLEFWQLIGHLASKHGGFSQ